MIASETFFMELSRSQIRSLAIGTVIVGIGLFILAGITWQNKGKAPTISTQPSKMISATSTATLTDTPSKVTYTVLENDNLAEIGKKLCGSENAWVSIAATNNLLYPDLIYPGETYIITCY